MYAEVWYDRQRMGPDTIAKFMRNLSENAKLSKIYTNHCIRKTCIVTLDNSGFEARHIIAVSSHKSETTIKEYSEKCPDSKREEMYDALTKQIMPTKATPSSENQRFSDQIPTFNILDTDPNDDEILDNFLRNTEHLNNDRLINELQTNKENQMIPQNVNPNQMCQQNPAQMQNQKFQSITQNFNNPPVAPFFPNMNFSNSNVTVNYNFYGNSK